MLYVTSDLHFGHSNVITFTNRPFKDVEEMDNTLISNWNSTVTDEDDIYILGDITLKRDVEYILPILKKLKGRKYLIKGNHDHFIKHEILAEEFVWIKDYYELKYNKRKFVLCHYPFEEWNNSYRGSYHLHGHQHNPTTYNISQSKPKRKYDVGCDANDYKPVLLDNIIQFFEDNN